MRWLAPRPFFTRPQHGYWFQKKVPKNKNQGPKKRDTNEKIREVLHEQSCAVELSCDEVQRKKCILFGTQQLGLDPWFEESLKIRTFGLGSRHFLLEMWPWKSLKVFLCHDGFHMDPIVDNRTGEVEIPTIVQFATRISDIHARSFFVVLFRIGGANRMGVRAASQLKCDVCVEHGPPQCHLPGNSAGTWAEFDPRRRCWC